MTFDRKLFKRTLQAHLAVHHLTLRQAAQVSGVSVATLSRLTNGYDPDMDTFARLVSWLQADANAFLHSTPQPQEQWLWTDLYACLDALNVSTELIEAIVTIVRLIHSREESGEGKAS